MTEAEEQVCPGCGMPRGDWENDGQGYAMGGDEYCCRGCATGTGCTCTAGAEQRI